MKTCLPADFADIPSQTGLVCPTLVDAIANWCEALNGSVSLQQAVACLVRELGAEAGMLVRTHRSDGRPVAVALHDERGERSQRPLRRSFADGHFGAAMRVPRTASIWLGTTQADPDSDPALRDWQAARRMKEFAVLVLAGGPALRDHIELHFAQPLTPEVQSTLAALLPTMVRTWGARQAGLVTRMVVNHRLQSRTAQAMASGASLLDISNPARLSRAEFRVCLLLSRGLSVAGVCEELGLTDATIRTHLRNIYAKSETSSLAELVFHLLRPRTAGDQTEYRCA